MERVHNCPENLLKGDWATSVGTSLSVFSGVSPCQVWAAPVLRQTRGNHSPVAPASVKNAPHQG